MMKRVNKIAIELPYPEHGDMNLLAADCTRINGWKIR